MKLFPTKLTSSHSIIIFSILLSTLFSLSGLLTPGVEGLDSSHNVMDGLFFYDLFRHDLWNFHNIKDAIRYPMEYQEQYPALGFKYWPPFWPVIESLFYCVFGPTLFAAQFSIFFFTCLFSICFTSIAKRISSPSISIIALIITLTSQELFFGMNTIMREIPAISMMSLSFWIMIRWIESNFKFLWLLAAAFSCVATLYTKQTTAIIFIALAANTCLYYKPVLMTSKFWVALIGTCVLVAPLILFTLTVASENLGQSFGNSTQSIMSDYKGLERWSIKGWTYYAYWLLRDNPGAFFSGLAGLVIFLKRRKNLEKLTQFILLTSSIWLISFYIFFSYFDNKSARFVTLAIPALGLLGAYCIANLKLLAPKIKPFYLALFSLFILAAPGLYINQDQPPRMKNIDNNMKAIVDIVNKNSKRINKCIAYRGGFKQVFVQALRRQDTAREISMKNYEENPIHNCETLMMEANTLSQGEMDYLKKKYNHSTLTFSSPKKEREIILFF